jgi:hypothetical protein
MFGNGYTEKLLLEFKELMDKHHISFWLECSTLLGPYRNKKLIDKDDLDVGLLYTDYWKVRKIIDESEWKYKHIWRNELAIYKTEKCHIDLFFFEEIDNKLQTCAHLGNSAQGGINIESAIHYNKDLILPFKELAFLGTKFNIPGKIEEYLVAHYGETWRTPDKKWWHGKHPSLNSEHRTIAIIITTFLRDAKLIKEIDSILNYCHRDKMFRPWIRLYIGEQGHIFPEKEEFYNKLKEKGHKIFKLPFNCGLSYARNFLVKQVTEPYVLIIDDDFEFTEETNLGHFINILLTKEDIGIVGGELAGRSNYDYKLILNEYPRTYNHLCYIKLERNPQYSISSARQKPITFYYTDSVLNFFLAKRQIFNDIEWDNELKLAEHTDFFLRLKTTKWKVVFSSNVKVNHQSGRNSNEYSSYRSTKEGKNCQEGRKKYRRKWNLDNNPPIKIHGKEIENFYIKPNNRYQIVQIARIPCANSGYELSKLINKYSYRYTSRYILGREYSKGCERIPYRQFPYDLFWEENHEECITVLKNADIIHIHHDTWDEILPYLTGKYIVSTLYNLTNALKYRVDDYNKRYLNKLVDISNIITISDQPLQRIMFDNISKTRVPLIKFLFNENTEKNNKTPIIIFAPTNRNSTGIGSKRYYEVLNIIKKLKDEGLKFEFDLIEGVPYEENLERKRKADIVIDDIDDNYSKFHNTSIEGACFGAIALTNYRENDYPFIKTTIKTLEHILRFFIINPNKLKEEQRKIVEWRKNIYTPQNLLRKYEEIYGKLIDSTSTITPDKCTLHKVIKGEIIEQKKEVPKEQIIDHIDYSLTEQIFYEISTILGNNNTEYCLLKTTCLDAVRFGKIKINPNTLYLGVRYLSEEVIDDLRMNGFIYENQMAKKKGIIIYFDNYPKEVKSMGLYGKSRNVPYPVVRYLKNLYSNAWRIYKLE